MGPKEVPEIENNCSASVNTENHKIVNIDINNVRLNDNFTTINDRQMDRINLGNANMCNETGNKFSVDYSKRNIQRWIGTFLNDRSQIVVVNGV